MIFRFTVFLFVLGLQMTSPSLAQTMISGHVIEADSGIPLSGVHITSASSQTGTVSDELGAFRLEVTGVPAQLFFSSVGYVSLPMLITDASKHLKIALLPTVIDLDPMVITATRELQPRSEVPHSIASIGASQLASTQPDMMHQVFNQVAGVYMADLGNDQYKLSIRQPLTNKAYYLFMEDGIALRPIGIFNPNAMLDAFVSASQRIEILRGPSSSVYGGNAVAGSINFISKDPFGQPTSTIGLRRNSYGYTRADGSTAWSNRSVGVSVDAFIAKQRESWYDHSDSDRAAISTRMDINLSNRVTLENALSYSDLQTDTNGALDSLGFVSRGFTSQHSFSYRKMRSLRYRSTMKVDWQNATSTIFTLFARDNTMDQLPYWRIRAVRGTTDKATGEVNSQSFWSVGGVVHHHTNMPRLKTRLQSGVSLDRSPSTYRAQWIDVDRDANGTYIGFISPDSLLSDYKATITNTAAFLQSETQPSSDLRISASLRYDRIQYAFDNLLLPSGTSGSPDETTSYDHLSPRIGVTYDLGRGRGLFSSAAFGFAPPEINELYHGASVPSLSSATFSSYELGGWFVLASGKIYLDVSMYTMSGKNEIIPIVSPNGSFTNMNAGKTRHFGVEYAIHFAPRRHVSIRFSGANSSHEFIEFVDFTVDQSGNKMAFSPSWIANMEVRLSPETILGMTVSGLSLSAEWSHVGPYYMNNSNSSRYEGYNIFNTRLAYRHGPVNVWAHVLNVRDTLYATNAAQWAWGSTYNVGQVRTLLIGATYRF